MYIYIYFKSLTNHIVCVKIPCISKLLTQPFCTSANKWEKISKKWL